jgi:hypothetical protein
MYTADQAGAGTDLLPAESGTSGPGNSLTYPIRPTHDKALIIKCVVAAKSAEADYIFITGTDAWGGAQTESLDVTAGNGTYTTTKRFATATEFDCSDNLAGGGTQWADGTIQVTQDIWGVVWEHVADGQYMIDANVDFGDGSTSAYFESLNEMVYFADGIIFEIESEATLSLGKLSGDWGIQGSTWRLSPGVNVNLIGIGSTTATFLMAASTLMLHSTDNFVFKTGIVTVLNSICISDGIATPILGFSVDVTLSINRFFAAQLSRVDIDGTPSVFSNFHHHAADSQAILSRGSATITGVLLTDARTGDIFASGASAAVTIKDPISSNIIVTINNSAGIIVVQYTTNIHVTDKDGACLQSVDVDCEYAHLVEGDDGKTYKCIQDHTAIDAIHKPITGSDYASFWELFDAGGGLGGDWITGFDYKAATEEFATQTTDANGDIAEQVIQYKKWTTTSELLEARIHKFTYTHVSYPDSIINDIIVDYPLVWEFDMGQSTSDLTTIVQDAAPTVDEIWAKAMVDLAAGAPSATASAITAMNYIYEAWRNKTVTDESGKEIIVYKDDGTTKLCESDISDDGMLFTKGEYAAPD